MGETAVSLGDGCVLIYLGQGERRIEQRFIGNLQRVSSGGDDQGVNSGVQFISGGCLDFLDRQPGACGVTLAAPGKTGAVRDQSFLKNSIQADRISGTLQGLHPVSSQLLLGSLTASGDFLNEVGVGKDGEICDTCDGNIFAVDCDRQDLFG